MLYQRIKYFLKAADKGSFSKAATEMYVTSQALTKQIRLLEEEIGGKLFERSSGGVTLTGLGEHAYEKFTKAERVMEDAVTELRHLAVEKKESLRVGIFSALPKEDLVFPFVSFLISNYPNYQIVFDMVELRDGYDKFLNGELDLFLTNTHEEDDWGDHICLSFGSYEVKVIVSLLHPWAVKSTITEEDMRQETYVKMEMGNDHYKIPFEESFYQNIPCKTVMQVSNFDTLYTLLQQGSGFAVFPMAFANMDRARIQCFDYPGRKFLFHTALVCNTGGKGKEFAGICEDIKEEFELEQY